MEINKKKRKSDYTFQKGTAQKKRNQKPEKIHIFSMSEIKISFEESYPLSPEIEKIPLPVELDGSSGANSVSQNCILDLGLNNEVKEFLDRLSENIKGHFQDMQLILKFFEMKNDEWQKDVNSSHYFEAIGYNKCEAEKLFKFTEENKESRHRPAFHWACEHLRDIFMKNFTECKKEPKRTHTNMTLTTTKGKTISKSMYHGTYSKTEKIKGDNDNDSKKIRDLSVLYEDRKKQENNFSFWYHGCRWQDAASIIEDGIDIDKGKSYCNFSHNKGFYLGTDFQKACSAASFDGDRSGVVLVFKVASSIVNIQEENIPDFSGHWLPDDGELWRNCVLFWTDGAKDKTQMEWKSKEVQYIFGPICSDGPPRNTERSLGILALLNANGMVQRKIGCFNSVSKMKI